MFKVIFACVHNAGRSQMAAAFFNQMAGGKKASAISAGTNPAERVHPEVVSAMKEWRSICRGRSHRGLRRSLPQVRSG